MHQTPIKLSDFSKDPENIRVFLNRLSKRGAIGVVEMVGSEKTLIIRAHADQYSYNIMRSGDEVHVHENLGPKTVRVWETDSEVEMNSFLPRLAALLNDYVREISKVRYFYTEHSDFVWRPHRKTYLSRIKRRFFGLPDQSELILHCRQSDIPEGDLLEYELQSNSGFWRWAYSASSVKAVQEQEAVHPVKDISF